MTTMKTLNDGSEISQDAFGSIFGGGLKKALDTQRKLKIGGEDFFFTIREMALLQKVIDQLVTESATARSEANRLMEENASLKARVRFLERQDKLSRGKRPVGRPRKTETDDTNVVSMKPKVRVQAGSHRMAA